MTRVAHRWRLTRGPLNKWRALLNNWLDIAKQKLEQLYGVDFSLRASPEQLGFDPEQVYCYTPSGDRFLRRLLKDFNINAQDKIIDIGCGKGSAMREMAKFPFSEVHGIELSTELADIARSNFSTLNLPQVKVSNCDATEFAEFHRFNVVYLFNPFPVSVLNNVLKQVNASLDSHPRELLIIYLNPIGHEEILATKRFHCAGYYPDRWGLTFKIYSNYSWENSRLVNNRKLRSLPKS